MKNKTTEPPTPPAPHRAPPRAPPAPPAVADPLLLALQGYVREAVARELASLVDWVDQSRSPLGRKQHIALAKTGKVRASKVGKKVLIWRLDLNDYIAAHPMVVKPSAANDIDDDPIGRMLDAAGIK